MSIQKVGAILRKAGHTASKYHRSGQVRGWGTRTEGYELRKDWDGHMARLSYTVGTSIRAGKREAPSGLLDNFASLLTAAGFRIERDGDCLLIDPPLEQ